MLVEFSRNEAKVFNRELANQAQLAVAIFDKWGYFAYDNDYHEYKIKVILDKLYASIADVLPFLQLLDRVEMLERLNR